MKVKCTIPKYSSEKEREIILQKAYTNLQKAFYYGQKEKEREKANKCKQEE